MIFLFTVVVMVLLMALAIAGDQIQKLEQEKRDWKCRYYAAAQIQMYESRNYIGNSRKENKSQTL